MKKKVGTITFHAAHNYGSNLQALALQKAIEKLGCDCEIINFRTERQKDQYAPLTKRRGLKYIIKNAYFLLNYKARKAKYDKFEEFIEKYLVKSQAEYSSLDELKENTPVYDYYISGSDQIWNTVPLDADDAYFLPFVKSGKRIAYAPSFGQRGTVERKNVIVGHLQKYDTISVREKYAQKLVYEMTGKEAPIMPDPTLLIEKEEWEKIIPSRIIDGDYIFFYTLFATKEMISIAKHISKEMNIPVVISNVSNQYEIFSGFEKYCESGPLQFLSLIKYAKFVCTTSFHGTVFSIILQKPFCAIDGMSDKRISTLLETFGLTERSVTKENIDKMIENAFEIDFNRVEENLQKQKENGVKFLKTALDIEG